MESSLATIIKIAKVSQELIVNLTDASRRGGGGPEISRLLFWLDKIVISSRAILQLLHQHMINSTAPDGQLQSWISANGPVICLLVLNEMKKKTDNLYFNHAFFAFFDPSSSREKIDEAIRVFDTHRNFFDCLLMSDSWNYKMEQLHQAVVATAAVHLHANVPTILDLGHFTSWESGIAKVYGNISKEESRILVDLKKLEAILRWLNGFRCIDKHVDTLLQRQPNTCTWLLETTAYKAWLASENPFLWLHGKAGSGKSVLVASTIEYLENTLVDGPLVFFYCDFGTEESTDATQVICSLLYQLLDQYRQGKVKPGALEIMEKLVGEMHKGDAALKNIMRLSSLVSLVAEQFCQRPLIIVDALDECKDIDCLLSALLTLKTDGVRLLVSSRPIQVIKHRFHGLPSISMDKMADEVSVDIELHVDREVDSHLRLALLDPILKQEVRSTLCQKADGMFRWVQCQLNALKACVTLQDLQETLNNLPMGLEATYERILLRIDQRPSEGKISRRALTWLVASSRPLILTEMLEALSIDLQMRRLDERVAPIHKYALLDVLGSLIVHNEETDIINLSHFSVKEYLVGEVTGMKLPAYRINLQEAHKHVFQLCMCYLSASLVSLLENNETAQPTEYSMSIIHSIPSLPLLDYVFSCSFDHLAHLEPTDGASLDSMTALQAEIQRRPQEWECMCRTASLYHAYKSWITPEHDFIVCVLISLLPESYLRAFLNRIPPRTKYKSNPLVHTVRFNKVDHARTLLLRGVDVNSSGCEVANSGSIERTIPLVVALQRENDALFDLFLKEGSAAIPRQVYSTVFLKSHCEYAPHLVTMLLQADEFVEWAARVKDANIISLVLDHRRYRRRQMSEEELMVVVRRLAQIGHDFCTEGFLLMVASAVSEGHLSLLKYLFLIEAPIPVGILLAEEVAPLIRDLACQGVNIDAIMAKGDIALHRVLECCSRRGLGCWTLDCPLCSESRFVLLTTFGREVERILAKIITITQKLVKFRLFVTPANTSWGGNNFVQTARVLRLLKNISSAVGTLLQAMNRSVLHGTDLDHHSKRWLSGQGPNACLEVLQQMENVTGADIQSVSSEEKFNNAIALLEEQQSYFRLLPMDSTNSAVRLMSTRRARPAFPQLSLPPSASDGIATTLSAQMAAEHRHISYQSLMSSVSRGPKEASFVFVGQPGIGKSALINMIIGIPDHSRAAAQVGRSAHSGTLNSACYSFDLTTGQKCELWDTRGLDAQMDGPAIHDMVSQVPRGPHHRTVLVWCIQATMIDVPIYWRQLREVHEAFYDGNIQDRPVPVVVVTQVTSDATGWEARCRNQIRQLDLRVGPFDFCDSVPVLRVRKHRGASSPEYAEDSKAIRDHIVRLALNPPPLVKVFSMAVHQQVPWSNFP